MSRPDLTAAPLCPRQVIADLEEEKRRHAQDTAEGDDVTYMLEKERERLLQQVTPQQRHNNIPTAVPATPQQHFHKLLTHMLRDILKC